MKVQVSVTLPPQAPGSVPRVDVADPLIKHAPLPPLVKVKLCVVAPPQATVIVGAAANSACAAGCTTMVLVLVIVLWQASVNVHVSVTFPPQAPGSVPNVDVADPEMRHAPLPPLVNVSEDVVAPPQATVIVPAAANSACAAGCTTIVLVRVMVCPQCVVVHVSVTLPPHAPGSVPRLEVTDPLTRHAPLPPLVKVKLCVVAPPQATVIVPAAANSGAAAGLITIVLVLVIV